MYIVTMYFIYIKYKYLDLTVLSNFLSKTSVDPNLTYDMNVVLTLGGLLLGWRKLKVT